jgi:hypothetical protein
MPLHPVRDKQARQTQGQLAHAFLQRNGQCRIGWQSEQCAQEDKAALECTQRSRQHERCDTNAGAKAFEDKRIDHAEGSGCPKACITNQTSPASAAHPIRRKTLARSMIGPVRYAATIASSAINESIVPRHGILGRPPERGGLQSKLPCACPFVPAPLAAKVAAITLDPNHPFRSRLVREAQSSMRAPSIESAVDFVCFVQDKLLFEEDTGCPGALSPLLRWL